MLIIISYHSISYASLFIVGYPNYWPTPIDSLTQLLRLDLNHDQKEMALLVFPGQLSVQETIIAI